MSFVRGYGVKSCALLHAGAITRLKVINHRLQLIDNNIHALSKLQVTCGVPGVERSAVVQLSKKQFGFEIKYLPTCHRFSISTEMNFNFCPHAWVGCIFRRYRLKRWCNVACILCVFFYRNIMLSRRDTQNKLGARSKHANWLTKFTSSLKPGIRHNLLHALKFHISASKTNKCTILINFSWAISTLVIQDLLLCDRYRSLSSLTTSTCIRCASICALVITHAYICV